VPSPSSWLAPARVAVGDVDLDAAEAAAREIGGEAFAFPLDIADRDGFTAFLEEIEERHGPLALLVNNAGVDWIGPFHEEPALARSRRGRSGRWVVRVRPRQARRQRASHGGQATRRNYELAPFASFCTSDDFAPCLRSKGLAPGHIYAPTRGEPMSRKHPCRP
jgi:NAD(P)-dependent dehydrogenase (short-subunit alcohol dehydrogenase family)